MKQIILIGDSIRLGYQAIVRDALQDVADVWGPDDNGRDSRYVLAHLAEWVIDRQPDVVHLNCGLHDIKVEFGSQDRAVPLDEYRVNLEHILTTLLTHTQAKVIWATTTPINEVWHHECKTFDRFEADVLTYNAAAVEIAQRHAVAINDLFTTIRNAGQDRLLTQDGVHFSPDGYALLGRTVAEKIRLNLPRIP